MGYISKLIGNNIEKHRKLKGVPLTELAEGVDISYQNLCKIVKGKTYPKEATFAKLCEYFKISPADLLTLNEIPSDLPEKEMYKLANDALKTLSDKNLEIVCKILNTLLETEQK